MDDIIKFETKEERFARQWTEALKRDEIREAALTEDVRRELTRIGKAAYARHLKERAEAKAKAERQRREDEKNGIRKVVRFHT